MERERREKRETGKIERERESERERDRQTDRQTDRDMDMGRIQVLLHFVVD